MNQGREALHTATLHIYKYRREIGPPQSIDHRCLAYCYTAYIYRREIGPPQSIKQRGLAYCYTAYI